MGKNASMGADCKILNLYAGIGGNRKYWGHVKDNIHVTAVEWDAEKAKIYRDNFPNDKVLEVDAHKYLLEHFRDYDFIWSSPPCPTHSQIRHLATGEGEQNDPVYPDMGLYQEILLLKHHFGGDWVIENVNSYYEPLIKPHQRGRHYFWSNFYIPEIELPAQDNQHGNFEQWEDLYGFDTEGYGLGYNKRQKVLRNCVHPELGEHILRAATTHKQTTLV